MVALHRFTQRTLWCSNLIEWWRYRASSSIILKTFLRPLNWGPKSIGFSRTDSWPWIAYIRPSRKASWALRLSISVLKCSITFPACYSLPHSRFWLEDWNYPYLRKLSHKYWKNGRAPGVSIWIVGPGSATTSNWVVFIISKRCSKDERLSKASAS